MLLEKLLRIGAYLVTVSLAGAPSYGSPECPCVGVAGFPGFHSFTKKVGGAKVGLTVDRDVKYTLSVGSSCDTWDNKYGVGDSACIGSNPPRTCGLKWCFVDPCNCKIAIPPEKTVDIFTYLGGTAYFSYATCGDGVPWEGEPDQKADCAKQESADEDVYGKKDCRCVVVGGKDKAQTTLFIDSQITAEYSGNFGDSCKAWDLVQPACKDTTQSNRPKHLKWCDAHFCFVDPCTCPASYRPQEMSLQEYNEMPMTFQGKDLYWSSETCGHINSEWTEKHAHISCISQTSQASCLALTRCHWTGTRCFGKELATECGVRDAGNQDSHVVTIAAVVVLVASALFGGAGYYFSNRKKASSMRLREPLGQNDDKIIEMAATSRT